jgi:hypothetical protein
MRAGRINFLPNDPAKIEPQMIAALFKMCSMKLQPIARFGMLAKVRWVERGRDGDALLTSND